MTARQIPNLITGLRLLLTPLLVLLLVNESFLAALLLFAVMGVSDALDGFLAKHYGWHSWLGTFLDPAADKAMQISSFITLGWLQLLPAWLVMLVILRDVIIVAGAAAYRLLIGALEINPSRISKINTFMQIILVLAVILFQFIEPPPWMLPLLIVLTTITTVVSGLDYIIEWSKRYGDQ